MKLKPSNELRGSILVFAAYIISGVLILLLNLQIMARYQLKTNIPTGSITFSALLYLSRTQLATCVVLLMAAERRITNINLSLKKIGGYSLKDHLSNVLKMHIKFNETISLINQCFSLRMTLNIFEMSFRWLILLFGCCTIYLRDAPEYSIPFVISGLLFSGPETTMMFLVVIFSGRLKNKIYQTEVSFKRRLLSLENNVPAFIRLQKASLQFDHENSVISCGLFNFGWPTLFSSFGTTMSFLIILIQFGLAGLT